MFDDHVDEPHRDASWCTKKPPAQREVQSYFLSRGFVTFPSLSAFAPPADKAKEEYEYKEDKAYKVNGHTFVHSAYMTIREEDTTP